MADNRREADKFAMNIPKDAADQVKNASKASKEKRGKGEEESMRIANPAEEAAMENAARVSKEKRGK